MTTSNITTDLNNHKINYKRNGKLFGLFFVLTFLCYGIGSSMFEMAFTADDVFAYVNQVPETLVIGAILMAILHTAFNIALPVLMLPVLKKNSPVLAYGYLSMAIAATVTLVIGVVFMLLMIPLSASVVDGSTAQIQNAELIALLVKKAGFYAYQMGMAIWGLGGLLMCWALLNRTGKVSYVPKWLVIWGLLGYSIFIAGTIFELFGFEYGLAMSAVGGLFELFLSGWLIGKGFSFDAKVD
jgi:hypothetical protein